VGEPLSVVHIFVPRQTAVKRLAQQIRQWDYTPVGASGGY